MDAAVPHCWQQEADLPVTSGSLLKNNTSLCFLKIQEGENGQAAAPFSKLGPDFLKMKLSRNFRWNLKRSCIHDDANSIMEKTRHSPHSVYVTLCMIYLFDNIYLCTYIYIYVFIDIYFDVDITTLIAFLCNSLHI